jgi:nitrogenase molybdenum-iron protein alpha/beta subunit
MKKQSLKITDALESIAKAEEIIITRITNTAWKIAYTALWNGEDFSRTEITKAKTAIRNFVLENNNTEKAFEEFTQRVLLARNYLISNPGKYAPIPSEWLNKENKNGFTGTERWFKKLQEKREAIPSYKAEWRDFCWSLFQLYGKKATPKFHEFRSYYAEKNQAMLNLYLATVANHFHLLREEMIHPLYSLS